MFCGGCLRDNALVAALRKLGHSVTMVPLYLPLTLDDADQTGDNPIFFGGISVYLDQKSARFRNAPRWLHRLLSSKCLLRRAARSAGKTQPAELGPLTASMLRGEQGNQAGELDELISWLLKQERPEVISLSNSLLAGLARRFKQELAVPIVCSLQGEDAFLDALPEGIREDAWATLAERAEDIDRFIAPSFYYAELMSKRLGLTSDRVMVIHNGINLDGYEMPRATADPAFSGEPSVGYFARMCPEKGMHLLIDAYIELCRRQQIPNVKLKIGGSCGPTDEAFVRQQKEKLAEAGVLDAVQFHPNISRQEKLAFLKSLSVFSVPAIYGEAFGLYVIEALAAGVPVVQPRDGAFPELLRETAGGLICDPTAPAIANGLEELLLNPRRLAQIGDIGQKNVRDKFSAQRMAGEVAQVFRQVIIAGAK